MQEIRNIAIVAHVDHGKTTLVDALLKQSENFSARGGSAYGGKTQFDELIMDSNELERERGITIFSKNASIHYGTTKINLVDTPGHADFGGEVERIMRMVDGVLLLVDAKEGPMPQTKFVLQKAIQAGHPAIVVINKIDKPDARPAWALARTYDLFIELGAEEKQIEFPVIYASATQGKAGVAPDLVSMQNIKPLFESIVHSIPPPKINNNSPLQMLTVNIAYDNYKGELGIGRLYSGVLKKGMTVARINRRGEIEKAQLSAVMLFEGLNRVDVEEAPAGEIVAIAGIPSISIGETIADPENPQPLPIIHIDEPTVKMTFGVNTSPFMGKEGKFTTSRNLRERLEKETGTDVALMIIPDDSSDRWIVSGRGELHLSILIEKMRREGYELEVSRPQVIIKEIDGKKTEPMELVSIEVPEEFSGAIIEMLGKRLGVMRDMKIDRNIACLDFVVPTRGIIGMRNKFLTATKGLGVMNSIFIGYEPYKDNDVFSAHGSLVTSESGVSNSYGLLNTQGRGKLFIGPGVPVYEGMVVGENAKANDLRVNACKARELTNFRSRNMGIQEQLEVPRIMGLEDALEYIGDDELVEITPKNIRIRKIFLTEIDRKRRH